MADRSCAGAQTQLGRCSKSRFEQSSHMSTRPEISGRILFAIAAATILALGACEGDPAPLESVASSETCGLAAKALQRQIDLERPLNKSWRLDSGPPPTFWARDAILPQAALEQAGAQERYLWIALTPEAPGTPPWLPRRHNQDHKPAKGPSVAMAQAFAAARPFNAAACPEVSAYAASKKASPAQDASARTPRRPSDFQVIVERAVLSPAGTEAIVSLAMKDAGTLVLYRKQPDGRWRETARTHSWIS